MRETFTIKRNDTSPTILYQLPSDVNLAGASVLFKMRNYEGTEVVSASANVVSASSPAQLSYNWQTGDTATAGPFEAEFEVTFADTSIQTFPNYGFIHVAIGPDV